MNPNSTNLGDVVELDRTNVAGPVSQAAANPVLVQVFRGAIVECQHRGIVLVLKDGQPTIELGNTDQQIIPRSLLKPILATSIVASGAAAALGLSRAELTLSTSSHFGQPSHLSILSAWGARIGIRLEDIKCGPHKPFDAATAAELIRRNQPASVLHNNNSGKHMGALSQARHLGAPIASYMEFDHPVQQEYRRAVEIFTGWRCSDRQVAIDACGMPTEAIPVRNLAQGYARMIDPTGVTEPYRSAAGAILDCIKIHPELMAARGKVSAVVMEATNGEVLVKAGSEGGYAAVAPRLGLAVIVKIDDGAHPASAVTITEVLHRIGALSSGAYDIVRRHFPPEVRTPDRKTVTGMMKPHF
jgi:L-asparaginase II